MVHTQTHTQSARASSSTLPRILNTHTHTYQHTTQRALAAAAAAALGPPPRLARQLTKHVVTRWYRAPELILLQDYTQVCRCRWRCVCMGRGEERVMIEAACACLASTHSTHTRADQQHQHRPYTTLRYLTTPTPQQQHEQAVDVWSLGCIFAELLSMQAESVPNHREVRTCVNVCR